MIRRSTSLLLTLSFSVVACKGVTPKTEPTPESAAPVAEPAPAAAPAAPAPAAPSAPAAGAATTGVGNRLAVATGTVGGRDLSALDARAVLTEMIFFDFDQSELRAEARETLDAKLAFLRANPAVRIRVAGHTDERGSDEYNLALGMRRAAAAKRYLVGLGIAESRIAVVSFGEERPLNAESTEAAWAQNRRDEFEVIAGEASTTPQ